MTAIMLDVRPAILRSSRHHIPKGPKIRVRDLVFWTNPNTGEVWSELVVEAVRHAGATVDVRGWFGRLVARTGDCLIETRTVRSCDLVVSGDAAEVAS